MVKKISFAALFIFLLVTISSCTSSTGHIVASQESQAQTNNGINKGQIPPDFTITTIDNRQLNLREFKNDNKPILLYFFASWCPYCSQDFDTVKGIYPKYADKVAFLAIDLDINEDAGLIRKYRDKKSLERVNFAEGNQKVLSDYAIKYTTTKYAIGRSGTIVYKGSGVFTKEQWEVLLDGLANS